MAHDWQGVPIENWLTKDSTRDACEDLIQFLTEQGTFRFPTVSSGLFSAAAAESSEFRLTGYQNVWTRDNCHIAHALWAIGEEKAAVRATEALLRFYTKYRHKFVQIINGGADPDEPMNRPHIRFDGELLQELDVRWSHAQNDALGAVLWLACKLLRSGCLSADAERIELLELFVRYFASVRYWQDEDSGHWEETRKIEASSIGAALAGLLELRSLLAEQPQAGFPLDLLEEMIEKGKQALAEILPAECRQPDPSQQRLYDGALLFLIYPLGVVEGEMAARIIADVREHLTGQIGIRRYIGDSYWCADYRDLLSAEVRTSDFSDDMSERDKLLKPGQEAQWCIFDPILSIIHGRQFEATGDPESRALQVHHLQRSLKQLTSAESRFPPYRCPESYFLEHGHWIPNDICPLLWTQANLRLALHHFRETCPQA
ncbi:glycoside hydrolase family 15 protein [Planctomicrobium sp. SH664]|uniref:glycoside hydrolase family 15 protein n=1 Tax=Planctomicrobium sp. SH664 TaxID=3448125 RepID=UPI003F5B83DF